MYRVIVGSIAFSQLLACHAGKPPRAPDESEISVAEGGDSSGQENADALPHEPKQDQEIQESPITDPVPQEISYFPKDCLALKSAQPSLASGVYTIYPHTGALAEMAIKAACDMETDGGGWTLILNYNHKGSTNPELNIRVDSLPLLGSNLLGVDESVQPDYWGHAGNEMLRSFTGFRELLFYCRSSENERVLHFKTSDESCLSAVQLGNGSCANIKNNFIPMSDHTAIIPAAADRAEIARLDETLTYNTFGKTEAEGPDRMWSIRAEPSQQAWECDYGSNSETFNTLHRVWIR